MLTIEQREERLAAAKKTAEALAAALAQAERAYRESPTDEGWSRVLEARRRNENAAARVELVETRRDVALEREAAKRERAAELLAERSKLDDAGGAR
jgi:hypothetical protein